MSNKKIIVASKWRTDHINPKHIISYQVENDGFGITLFMSSNNHYNYRYATNSELQKLVTDLDAHIFPQKMKPRKSLFSGLF